jgi:antirestriction protein
MKTINNTNPTIKGFICNLGKYNEGVIMGEWITFPISGDELKAVLDRIGINDYYEEIFFPDWECELDTGFGEWEDIDAVNELAEALEDADADLLEAIIEADGCDLADALARVDDCIFYAGMTLEDVAYELVQECYNLPEFALRYFDYEAFARDLSFDGYTETRGGVILMN